MLKIRINNGTPAELDTSDASAEEMQILTLRAKRNSLLQESDKFIIADFPTDKKNEWETYRESLRDMDFSDPDSITWPERPNE